VDSNLLYYEMDIGRHQIVIRFKFVGFSTTLRQEHGVMLTEVQWTRAQEPDKTIFYVLVYTEN
jgi:hypothetical protein